MNIFERKLKQSTSIEQPLDPVELFQTLFHKQGYEYLRGVQEEILTEWHRQRDKRDVIGKMNTGAGKTLTGLLMLYSKLVEKVGPCAYLCPDNQLVAQTIKQAQLYGIPVCYFEKNGDFPLEFLNKQHILICTFDKLFNGKSIFVRDDIQMGAILLDDAHACVVKARENASIKVGSDHDLYKRLLALFSEELKRQAPGTFSQLADGDPTIYMRVPYWEWMSKNSEVLKIISEYRKEEVVTFTWNFISNELLQYDCFFTGKSLEISPIHVPYYLNPSLNEAKHRYVLSATFEDDTVLLKDLGINEDSIRQPLVPKDRKDIGERLILAPSRYSSELHDEKMRQYITAVAKKHNVNAVVLVPSDYQAKPWSELGAEVVNRKNIDVALNKLKITKGNLMVFVNRYDGIDLLGDMCRILVLDGKPSLHSLRDRYMGSVRNGSSIINSKLGQTIEQGLGRAVRSGSDDSVVFVLNPELVRFLGVDKNLQYFTTITRAQINLGLQLLDGEDGKKPLSTINDVVNLCLNKDLAWRKFHQQTINELKSEPINSIQEEKLELAEIEKEAARLFRLRQYTNAAQVIREYINKNPKWFTDKDTAWYLQFAAQLLYLGNQVEANDLQIKSAEMATGMFHPPLGTVYTKITKPGKQAALVRQRIASFSRPQDVAVHIESILESVNFNPDISSERFEGMMNEMGDFLGFSSQRPENELGNGPDLLWCMTDTHYLLKEAKSQKKGKNKISRSDIEQLYHSEKWFQKQYGEGTVYSLVTLQPSNEKERDVTISNNTFVMDTEALTKLKRNVRGFITALSHKQTDAHTEREIAQLLREYKLTASSYRSEYLKKIR
ncbi:DEAD/DEAH box helicase family protein [Priestia sp. 179-F W1.4 NHS]|uniref:DEAD/DEAH box helicase family protein n=1 Tax=Priestia sp. 179-F W1.4 NHS TaxID=3374296 RepID=UPI003879F3AF